MSALSAQSDELREAANRLDEIGISIGHDTTASAFIAHDVSERMRSAADTIEKLEPHSNQLEPSRYSELFGTPEKAAEYFAMQCFGSDGSMCYYCPFDDCDENLCNSGAYPHVYDSLLEWLRGDA